MLAFCRSLTAVIALGLAVTASAAQERGADRNNSHEDARQHASEHRVPSDPRRVDPGRQLTLQSGHVLRHVDGARSAAPDV